MQTPSGKREQNKVANRATILDSARRLFAEQGYDAVTIRDVIRATPLASGTFYNYFPDKESLLRSLVEERLGELTDRLIQARRTADDMEQFLRGAYLTTFEEVCAHPEFYRMMFRNEPVIRAYYTDNVFGHTMRMLKIDLADAVARGLLADVNVDYLTAIMFGTGYEVSRMLVDRQNPDPKEAAEFATRLFVNGLAGLQPEKPAAELIRRGPLLLKGSAR
ncbi:TetR/AcrR family transcriptional regulator [Solimonas sp. K1W22B-7]|uniref:TetR/AcrR family transcriptional regulator n=1 Tax=Solimonas sp. K1W22B-7 TaxID=2303331 RepID=UPI000E32FFCA|nr:TetR/AcrR family transcriptional regulator [Solimonas sp. K1W22B-7]AXQ29122.1 TetR/AcrR family transcriptional regulator [Solimonas sp. K1W22B-7]